MARIYSFGALGSAPIGYLAIGDSSTYPLTTTPVVAPTGGGSYEGKAKRNWIVRKGGKLEVYKSAADAIRAVEAEQPEDKPDDVETVAEDAPKTVEEAAPPEPVEVITLGQIKVLARRYDELEAYRQAVKAAQYEGLIALFERLQDEEDVEMLLAYA